ncbi:hypothetical protein GRI38_10600 [Altererythrobacter aurantiacus]|uniref:Uncharacterized protein n=1 Tax=Parapontixanthobacter aurantiacus TaxID=1463599 RepID=A0A844ZGH6_9SPHN|nr:hypothetical protein [Parapontixanthobacter aurantiacus]MXO86473.1 hypothetical protein [Parapontixanthobacter aurantiacus]
MPISRIGIATANFEDKADRIIADALRIQRTGAASPFENRLGFFKTEAYKLLRRTITAQGGHTIITSIVRKMDVDPSHIFYRGNEFHYGLLAIDPHFDVIDAKGVSRFARQFAYAHKHDVPAHLLIGFLYQSGSTDEITRKLQNNTFEPWFGKV